MRPCGTFGKSWTLLLSAWIVALVSTAGALFVGEVMGMTPCLLCWYQRILMFPLALILGMATFSEDRRGAVYALPLAVGGALLAGYHTALVAGWVPPWWIPCGTGPSCGDQSLAILAGIQLPWLSLGAFVAVVLLLLAFLRKTSS
ncbi:disulfide bond formation protein B [Ramlibacter sp. AW1]|uniref:Disulfide bond formation protein B n=1 Tax=Ramlibacter aurantiacus TaxID=2801330 RepID=A0A936ZLS1_9BURK|nr:disulfide bond formation protein B [Ramlibacter aurantiacus]MBL0422533.1 disulfide bond formation protein B [Ramlibacter aurantiacus]